MKFVRNFCTVLLVVLWAALLLFQHVACFDVFGSNLWYLYVLAIAFAAVQFVLICFVFPRINAVKIPGLCCVAYSILAVAKFVTLIAFFSGLSVLCLALDAIGTVLAYRIDRYVPEHTEPAHE